MFTMKAGDKRMFGGLVFLLAGVAAQTVKHPRSVCAVKGSSVTLPCSFKPAIIFVVDEQEFLLQIVRVVWCKNHLICQSPTPTVYDSESKTNDPRFLYLGDKRTNCTLQIRDVREEDNATFRFRMEAADVSGHFTKKTGVIVSVVDESELRIESSSDDGVRSEGQNIKLLCTSRCSTHQLNITWFRDGHALSETGPALQLSALTAGDSGNYTCGSKTSHSPPYSLHVDVVATGSDLSVLITVHLPLLALHTVLIIVVTVTVVHRTCDCRKAAAAQQQTSM
ncbi:sialic acid-binding Ig-like lectin 10 [Solea senegalensis]|uniref:Sialic acid-binding Ig-like lectin 10 n=1 Tax=Solea senegalensis TaxID=28829 RepID=A0AAV6PM68_SOLSE|nr:B-cell receptor CD22-like [Solea senegalensis]KAG7470442.1 sialic acid-binding Ig-like lectin 10 [Solea senegalensis]